MGAISVSVQISSVQSTADSQPPCDSLHWQMTRDWMTRLTTCVIYHTF